MEKCFTKEGLKKLKEELAYLEKEKRKEVAEKLKHAASFGDLSENSAYDEAKNEQNLLEIRIAKLRKTIKEAKVIENGSNGEFVQLGSRLKVEVDGEKKEFEIAESTSADPLEGKISCESPMGKAFLGKKEGDVCIVVTPSGEKKFRILKIV